MKLAFCLFKYFPYGGLQRDFLRIARLCRDRGHEIHVYTTRWEAEEEAHIHLHLIKATGWQNHTRSYSFIQQVEKHLQGQQYDLVIGFNKMPHLDLYYAADVCYQFRIAQSSSRSWYRLLPRYQYWTSFEQAVFACGSQTEIMCLSPKQETEYQHVYQTESERFHLLPPGIERNRRAPSNAADIRREIRKTYQLAVDDYFLLMVGSGFKTKGLDRAIKSLAALPAHVAQRCYLKVIGKDDPRPFLKLAKRLKVEKQIDFLGGRSDVPAFLLAADLLLQPSYHENTGTAILEAMVAGLPVLTVDSCGYAHYVTEADAGYVVPTPFEQQQWNEALQTMIMTEDQERWRANGLLFSNQEDIYGLPEKAVAIIEAVARKKCESLSTA